MRYLILGGGAAGIAAARELRSLDQNSEIHLFSEDIGGYSRCMLYQYLSGKRSEKRLQFTESDFEQKWKIQWHRNCRIDSVDTEKKCVISSNGSFLYDRLLIASGAVPALPKNEGFSEAKNIYGFRNLADARKLKTICNKNTRVFLMGTGLVGMDVAYALLQQGVPVIISERSFRIMKHQTDDYSAKRYQELFQKAGAVFVFGKSVDHVQLDEDRNVRKIIMSDGEEIPVDLVVAATGIRPNTQFLSDSGIQLDRGICVDPYMETSVKGIYAAGDVTGLSGIWSCAVRQGRIAARNMAGGRVIYRKENEIRNSMNFFVLPMISIGKMPEKESADVRILVHMDGRNYQKIARKGRRIVAVQIQGDVSHAGIWEYLIQNEIQGDWSDEELVSMNAGLLYGFSEDSREHRKQCLMAFM